MKPPRTGTSNTLEFHCNFARLPLITKEVYEFLCIFNLKMDEQLPRELLDYYVTALLWARLLHIKRFSSTRLTVIENEYLQKFVGKSLPLPEPIYNILTMIGNINDYPRGSGLDLYLSDHKLPVAVRDGRGGYHARRITMESQNLFEEVPSLGVSGDCILFLVGPIRNPAEPMFPFLPHGAVATPNMVGYLGPRVPITARVSSALTSLSISAYGFKEDIADTRLNIGLIDYVKKIIQKSQGFALKNFRTERMPIDGSMTQLIQTFPVAQTSLIPQAQKSPVQAWTQRFVQPQTFPFFDPKCVEASYYTGFQLWKEDYEGDHTNWCCVKRRDSLDVSTLSNYCILKRNSRRDPIVRLWGIFGGRLGNDVLSQSAATQKYCAESFDDTNF